MKIKENKPNFFAFEQTLTELANEYKERSYNKIHDILDTLDLRLVKLESKYYNRFPEDERRTTPVNTVDPFEVPKNERPEHRWMKIAQRNEYEKDLRKLGWIQVYEFCRKYNFLGDSTLSQIIQNNYEFFKNDYKLINRKAYVSPLSVIDFIVNSDKCSVKLKNKYKNALSKNKNLQELSYQFTKQQEG